MLCIIGPLVGGLVAGVVGTGIEAGTAPSLAVVRNRPGDFLRVAQEIQRLEARGLEPRVSSDPFTGNILISTADQPESLVRQLALEAAVRSATQSSPAFSEALFRAREAFIESRRGSVTPVLPSSAPAAAIRPASVVPTTRVGRIISRFPRRAPGPLAVLR